MLLFGSDYFFASISSSEELAHPVEKEIESISNVVHNKKLQGRAWLATYRELRRSV